MSFVIFVNSAICWRNLCGAVANDEGLRVVEWPIKYIKVRFLTGD